MHLNPDTLTAKQRYKLMIGSVIPRPIAFVSTQSKSGDLNLAPYSFYTIACFNPMILAFFPVRFKKEQEKKDSYTNIMETGEFVVNVATEAIMHPLNATSGKFDAGVNEFELAGLTPSASQLVRPPGVLESPIRMECRLENTVSFGDEGAGGSDGIFGRVVHFYADDSLIEDYRIDEQKVRPIARLAGVKYSGLGDITEIDRPE
jgi:flavin reductase (DIM6/NTAB) family NADH-FMN oxidoreductase RutF